MSALMLTRVPNPTPKYDVHRAGVLLGTVGRTGSLPSCQRWWAYGVVGPSFATRREAVAALVERADVIDAYYTEEARP